MGLIVTVITADECFVPCGEGVSRGIRRESPQTLTELFAVWVQPLAPCWEGEVKFCTGRFMTELRSLATECHTCIWEVPDQICLEEPAVIRPSVLTLTLCVMFPLTEGSVVLFSVSKKILNPVLEELYCPLYHGLYKLLDVKS